MNELGNPPRKEYRKTHPKHVPCSKCGNLRLKEFIQSDYKLMLPLCKKCLNDAPGALVDLINRMNTYITDLEKNRDNFQTMAGKTSEAIALFAGKYKDHEVDMIVKEMAEMLEYQNKITKTLHRP